MGSIQKTNNSTSRRHCRKNERIRDLNIHQPVLLKEVLKFLNPSAGENFVDCTLGFAGHSKNILQKNRPNGKVLGIESDSKVIKMLSKATISPRLIIRQGNFSTLDEIVQETNFYPVHGILFDLGLSIWQIKKSRQGFSFQKDEPLLMNYTGSSLTAQEIVNKWPEEKLTEILRQYGEERYARRIAHSIYQTRQNKLIKTTGQLVEIISQAVPAGYKYKKIHFATKTFQALRIVVNDELNNLSKALPRALEILEQNGRLLVISFHSLEDRIVKNFFRQKSKEGILEILTKKPVRPTQEEKKRNPRSRSAKLRAAKKLVPGR